MPQGCVNRSNHFNFILTTIQSNVKLNAIASEMTYMELVHPSLQYCGQSYDYYVN